MESTQRKPASTTRRRVTVAVLLLGLGWWFWPRVDQRFVGTWDVVAGSDYFPFGSEERLVLSSDGFGVANPGDDYPTTFAWRCEGKTLRLFWYDDNGRGSYILARLASYPALEP